MGKFSGCLAVSLGICILGGIIGAFEDSDKKEEKYGGFRDYKSACDGLDFHHAYQLVGCRYPEDYWTGYKVKEKFDYIFNAEVTYLCSLKTKDADERVIHLLLELPSQGKIVDENVKYSGDGPYTWAEMYIEYIKKFNERCDVVLEKAILEGNKTVASTVLRQYKKDVKIITDIWEEGYIVLQTGEFTDAPQLAAQKKFEQAVADGAFDGNEDEN